MNLHMIAGPPGAGKTTTGEIIDNLGYPVFDIDQDRLAQPTHTATGNVVPIVGNTEAWWAQHGFAMNPGRLALMLEASRTMPIFITGTITDNSKLWEACKSVSYLSADAPTVDYRLEHRENHTFGKAKAERDMVCGNLAPNLERAIKHGAYVIDATQTKETVAGLVIAHALPNAPPHNLAMLPTAS